MDINWAKLDLSQASNVKKENDQVIHRLTELINTNENNYHDPHFIQAKQRLVSSIQSRIQELENFYLNNSDDERAILFEKERLRLRKTIQIILNASNPSALGASNSVASSHPNRSQNHSHTQSHSQGQNQSLAATASQHSAPQQAPAPQTPVQLSLPGLAQTNTSVSVNRSKRSPGSTSKPIYAWETGQTGDRQRSSVTIDSIVFEPTALPGFYKRVARQVHKKSPIQGEEEGEMADDADQEEIVEEEDFVELSDKFVDFQIILTEEEMRTLASRKKRERDDVKLLKSQAAATSIHSATPYIDPKRITQELLRPQQPDKWVASEGMRPVY